jgi:Phage tail protein (Tail_P2_I)
MNRPTNIGNFGESVWTILELERLVPNGTDNDTWVTLLFIGALGQAFEQMDELAHKDPDTGTDPWGKLLDIDLIPDEGVPWLGQFVGVDVNSGLSINDQKAQVRDRAGWKRGTPTALKDAVRPLLTGTQTVAIVERDTDAYHFDIATYSDETPNQTLVLSAITAAKPAGLQFVYHVIAGSPGTSPSYENLYLDYTTYSTTYSGEQSYQDVYNTP